MLVGLKGAKNSERRVDRSFAFSVPKRSWPRHVAMAGYFGSAEHPGVRMQEVAPNRGFLSCAERAVGQRESDVLLDAAEIPARKRSAIDE